MIILGGVLINENMYLEGIEKATPYHIDTQRTVDGVSVSRAFPTTGGRKLTLGTSSEGGSVQGIWCQRVIDQVKQVQQQGNAVLLDYHGTQYTVFIVSTDSLTQMFKYEPVTPDKKYTGTLNLTEV